MALETAIANRLEELFNAAFSRSGETGAALAPLHDLLVQKAATGVVDSELWLPAGDELFRIINRKGLEDELPIGENYPTNKTHYMIIFNRIAFTVEDGLPFSEDEMYPEMVRVIEARGGPGASNRNMYLQYLLDSADAIAAASA